MSKRKKVFLGIFASIFAFGIGVELYGVYADYPEDTITELLIAPLVNFDVAGFPVGWSLLMGFLVWLGVHSHNRRDRGI